jgi:hypothetical protein
LPILSYQGVQRDFAHCLLHIASTLASGCGLKEAGRTLRDSRSARICSRLRLARSLVFVMRLPAMAQTTR